MQEVLPQPSEAFEAYMDSHVQEATQEGEESGRRLFSIAVLLNLDVCAVYGSRVCHNLTFY